MKARDKVQMFDDISRLGLDTRGEDLAVGVVLLAAHSLNAARHRAQRRVGATRQRRGTPSTVVLEVASWHWKLRPTSKKDALVLCSHPLAIMHGH